MREEVLLECVEVETKTINPFPPNSKKWRVNKMLSSGTFARDFNNAKESVLQLKAALRDFLDEETQNAQDEKLKNIEVRHR